MSVVFPLTMIRIDESPVAALRFGGFLDGILYPSRMDFPGRLSNLHWEHMV
jgi:hypothetical protein